MTPPVSVVAVALGTRGDVQPVALVAWQLAKTLQAHQQQQHQQRQQQTAPGPPHVPIATGKVNVTLITHEAHSHWLQQLQLSFADAAAGRQLQLLLVSTPPAAVWQQEVQGDSSAGSTRQQQQQQASGPPPDLPAGAPPASLQVSVG